MQALPTYISVTFGCACVLLSQLLSHLEFHSSRIRTITSEDCMNILVSEPVTRVHMFLFENLLVFVHIFMRLCTLDGVSIEIHSGVINHPGFTIYA